MKKQEFYQVSENWYQRTHKLRRVWQNKENSLQKRVKAFYLFQIMMKRVLHCTQIAIKINQVNPKS